MAGGMGMLFQTLTLPEGMAVSSADVIASLNEHLVQTLHVSMGLMLPLRFIFTAIADITSFQALF